MPKQRPSIFPRKVSDLVWLKLTLPRKFKLLRSCNNGFVQDYQFSTKRRSREGRRKTKILDPCSMLYVFACLGFRRDESERCGYPLEDFNGFEELEDIALLNDKEEEKMADWEEGCSSSSVDERAEKFIQKFYQQMRMQRLESS